MIVAPNRPPLSASTLRLFSECQRRYEYALLAPRPWPAPANANQTETEAVLSAGSRLHQLVHLHALGHDPRPLARSDERLRRWYESYRASSFASLEGDVFSEQKLVLPIGDQKLVVKFDRLVRQGDRWLILDWKTSKRAPEPESLADDWQARLYPFALVEAGAVLNDGVAIAPEQVEMAFFYLEPRRELRFAYDADQHDRTRAALGEALAAIARAGATGLPPTGKATGRCERPVCRYYTLCHMQPLPDSEFAPEDGEAADEAPGMLTLAREFEFEDEPVWL